MRPRERKPSASPRKTHMRIPESSTSTKKSNQPRAILSSDQYSKSDGWNSTCVDRITQMPPTVRKRLNENASRHLVIGALSASPAERERRVEPRGSAARAVAHLRVADEFRGHEDTLREGLLDRRADAARVQAVSDFN